MTESRKLTDDDYLPVGGDEELLFADGDVDSDEDDDDDEAAWRLRPDWLHPDCRNVCLALELGTCCKYPDNPLVRVAMNLADSVDHLLGRLGLDCASTEGELVRTLKLIPGLLAQIHAISPRLNRSALAQLLCPVGRLASALDEVRGGGCPWACGDPAVPDRRAEFAPLTELVAECSAAVRAALGWRSAPPRGSRPRRAPGPA
ncbi:MAG: hypothetical protein ACRDN0_16500 [Trebonia sp.]